MGQLIEFYKPVKKPKGVPLAPVEYVMKLLSEHSGDIENMYVFIVDKQSKLGYIGTMTDDAEIGRFLQRFGWYRGTV